MMSLTEYLDAECLGLAMEEELEDKEQFKIKTKDEAVWAVRKIKYLRDQQAENDQVAQTEITRIEQWRKKENDKLQREIDFFASILVEYHQMVLEIDPKAKTIKLPHGELQFRRLPPEYIRDDEKLLAWLKDHNLPLVRVKEEPDWAAIKPKLIPLEGLGVAVMDGTGEEVDGVQVNFRPPKFTVKTD